jgi:hypothetical protein
MIHGTQEQSVLATRDSHLQNTKELYGDKLAALDGDIGHVRDFYFDDRNWVIRYLVADTGSWLAERLVLISPHALGDLEQYDKTLRVRLRKLQIENSPSIDLHKPVSRQDEMEYYRYYGWPAYWDGTAMWGYSGFPVTQTPAIEEAHANREYHHRNDKHLRSSVSVAGHDIHAADGVIGRVSGFLVDDRSWEIADVVVETGHWYAGKEVMIPASKIERISYEESKVYVTLTKADIQQTPENQVAKGGVRPHRAASVHEG